MRVREGEIEMESERERERDRNRERDRRKIYTQLKENNWKVGGDKR